MLMHMRPRLFPFSPLSLKRDRTRQADTEYPGKGPTPFISSVKKQWSARQTCEMFLPSGAADNDEVTVEQQDRDVARAK